MCLCTPGVKTPFCGRKGCEWPAALSRPGQPPPLQVPTMQVRHPKARPRAEWHEDDGPVLWWTFPVAEAPYCGTPLDDDWPYLDNETPYWTTFEVPDQP